MILLTNAANIQAQRTSFCFALLRRLRSLEKNVCVIIAKIKPAQTVHQPCETENFSYNKNNVTVAASELFPIFSCFNNISSFKIKKLPTVLGFENYVRYLRKLIFFDFKIRTKIHQ